MFRLTHLTRRILAPADPPTTARHRQTIPSLHSPVVVWNVIRRCNLQCHHCYSASADRDFSDELTTAEALRVIDDLAAMPVAAIIFSGGEPLLRQDLLVLVAAARSHGLYVALSSNGLLLADETMADQVAAAGFDYVGISLDGLEAHHDQIRGQTGAFRQTVQGIRHACQRGLNVGLRYTLTRDNQADLAGILELMQQEQVARLYLSHLNYAGRGYGHRDHDSSHTITRTILQQLFDLCHEDIRAGRQRELVTGNNDADAPFWLQWLAAHTKDHPERQALAEQLLQRWGGNSSGIAIANIDNRGLVHPDIFWWSHTLGSVREQSFAEIWRRDDDPLLNGLRQRPRPLQGRCQACRHLPICGGNTRVRAWQTTGDPWAEDPGCYLTDAEIGLSPQKEE
ncbi:MAG: heme d1 biosynthesis radical SAM protein NirJ [Magnetococcales bacterium]|nr:heme d1 biosynthesis radical SAM protein NirJ [Magnetococcales bacterium]